MRVLVVTARFDLIGGSERYAGEVVRSLVARGWAVEVLTAQAPGAGVAQDAGVSVTRLPALLESKLDTTEFDRLRAPVARCERVLQLSRVGAPALELFARNGKLARFVQDHTLFCPGLNKQFADGGLCEKSLGAECLSRYWLRDGCSGLKIQGAPSLRFPLRALSERLHEIHWTRRARRVLVASQYMRTELLRAGLADARISVLPYFTNSASAALSRGPVPGDVRAFMERAGTTTVLTPARLTLPDKGLDFLLTALGKVPEDIQLLLVGDGPAREWLATKACAEGLAQRVHFSGWLGSAALESLYADCAFVAFPSVWNEPFGLVGIEAMAHGKAVVAFESGGVREWLVDGQTGLLCPRLDVERFAQAMLELARDSKKRARLGDAGRERVQAQFREKTHMQRLCELLNA